VLPPGVPAAVVRDGRSALARLAAAFHGFPARKLRVVGVTGTDGKTTTSSLVLAILEAAGQPAGAITTVSASIAGRELETGLHTTTPDSPAVQSYLASAAAPVHGVIRGLIAPHAGLIYSGPVGAFAYAPLAGRHYDLVVLVGPSHFVAFDGVSVVRSGAFDTPLGALPIAEAEAEALIDASDIVHELPAAHGREHSLEMQLPFVAHLLPAVPIVPIVMGHQTTETIGELGRALGIVLAGRNALFVASSDLSHYHDSTTAGRMDAVVIDCVERFDPEALQHALEFQPDHACGGGPIVAVMRAALALGATDARILDYADSGDVSGDKSAVVGYLAAAFGTFE
jgi:AmmeMemoRadiSam system protein B